MRIQFKTLQKCFSFALFVFFFYVGHCYKFQHSRCSLHEHINIPRVAVFFFCHHKIMSSKFAYTQSAHVIFASLVCCFESNLQIRHNRPTDPTANMTQMIHFRSFKDGVCIAIPFAFFSFFRSFARSFSSFQCNQHNRNSNQLEFFFLSRHVRRPQLKSM